MKWFREHVASAKAVLISPQIVQAGFIVGGSGGPALVIARNRSGTGWNGPAFYRMVAGSIGQPATPVDILVTRSVSNPYSTTLAQAATSAVAHGE